ncbi:zinc finger protein 385D-like isoform X2 [Periplaneta americana]|uniref:zinc finger protein 385D-like isoform X2 n=1 Tax=Periplaneta americana TaxID=6978 RepID=UPI0037E75156
MSFYTAPGFQAVATMVGYRWVVYPKSPLKGTSVQTSDLPHICARDVAAHTCPALPSTVPLSQPLVATLPLPPVTGPTPTPAPGPPTKPTDVLPPANFHNSDPVTKAVMDNIMGKLPTKKQAVTCKCDICGLEFSGQIVLETHLAGAKHAKKVKSQEILKQLQSSGQTFTRDEKTRILKCEVCDVVVNSSQQLQTHLAGNKHKQKALKKGALANAVQKPAQTNTTTSNSTATTTTSTTASTSTSTVNSKGSDVGTAMSVTPGPATAATAAATAGEVPPGVQKLPDAAGAKTNKYFCDTCNVSLNSEIQLEQHLGSRKHKDKLLNGGKSKPRMAPYWKKPRPSYQQTGKPNKVPMALQYSQPLSNNFVSGGAMM